MLRGGKWDLAFAGHAERAILSNSWLELWLDSERRGRLLGIPADKVKAMGLIHSSEAKLVGASASIGPDGSATLVLTRSFPDVTWTETYTLEAGQPVLRYEARFEMKREGKRYLAFVEHGAGMRGDFGPLLKGKTRFKYDNPKAPSRILLSGSNNSFTRLAWRSERCWAGVESELGDGIGFSTSKEVTLGLPGSSIWSIGNSGFFVRFIDPEQENFPYEFSAAKPLELGLAFVASTGGTGIWEQTRRLFRNVTQAQSIPLSTAYGVYLGDAPLRAAEVSTYAEQTPGRNTALEIDFQRAYRLSVSSQKAPVAVRAYPIGEPARAVAILSAEGAGIHTADFTALTGWQGKRQKFVLEVSSPGGATLDALKLVPAAFPAPELGSPADRMSLTHVATFFRWKQVQGALDYEIQLSRDSGFNAPITLSACSEVELPYYLPADNELPQPGRWFWRVRAVEPARPGAWSSARSFTVNHDIARKTPGIKISPEHPLFTIEANGVTDLRKFANTIPADLKPYFAFNANTHANFLEYFKPLHDFNQNAFVRTHHPGPVSGWMPLSDVEQLFQAYPNVIGIMGGETLSAHYQGGAAKTYVNRLLKLCGKYGRIFYDADGTYPEENKWEALYAKEGALMREYGENLIFAQKNNILHRQFVSQSSVLGLYLAGAIAHQGAWEDGGWYWQQVGFRKLGDIRGQRGGEAKDMPRNFWNLTFLMGVSRGTSVFSFDGQTGTIPVGAGWKIQERGLPPNANPMAHWTTEGELTLAFKRFMEPFVRAVIRHRLVPTKEQVLDSVHLAVYNDGVPVPADPDHYYYEWKPLYEGTYGFRPHGVIPGTLMEFFPNTGRYYYIPVLPQGKIDLGHGIETLPLSSLTDAKAVTTRFDRAYPQWYEGNAFVTLAGDTLAVMNSNENLDVTEEYKVSLKNRRGFQSIAGKIGPHAYVVGKFENGNDSLWLQANTEYPERDTELAVACNRQPAVKITPPSAARMNEWNAKTGTLTLRLSHSAGAVEVEIAAPTAAQGLANTVGRPSDTRVARSARGSSQN